MRKRSSKPPPEPEGRPPNPRRKEIRAAVKAAINAGGLDAAKEAVRRLSESDPGPDHFEEFQEEAGAERADRGAAILLATNLENTLQRAIERTLQTLPRKRRELFGFNGPINTFSYKIMIANAIGIFGETTRSNFEIIRIIRNAFAHAKRPIRFADEPMYTLCNFLVVPAKHKFDTSESLSRKTDTRIVHPARAKFREACENTSRNLMLHNFSGPNKFAPEVFNLDPGYVVLGFDPPLP